MSENPWMLPKAVVPRNISALYQPSRPALSHRRARRRRRIALPAAIDRECCTNKGSEAATKNIICMVYTTLSPGHDAAPASTSTRRY